MTTVNPNCNSMVHNSLPPDNLAILHVHFLYFSFMDALFNKSTATRTSPCECKNFFTVFVFLRDVCSDGG